MSGLHVLGRRRRSTAVVGAAPQQVIGWRVEDYNWGESAVLQMNQYFNSLGRPKQFENAAETIWAAYENAKSAWAIQDLLNASEMKSTGEQAVALRKQLEAWAQSQGKGAPPPRAVPDAPPPADESVLSLVPWWVWGIASAVGLGALAIYAVPPIMSALAARKMIAR